MELVVRGNRSSPFPLEYYQENNMTVYLFDFQLPNVQFKKKIKTHKSFLYSDKAILPALL